MTDKALLKLAEFENNVSVCDFEVVKFSVFRKKECPNSTNPLSHESFPKKRATIV